MNRTSPFRKDQRVFVAMSPDVVVPGLIVGFDHYGRIIIGSQSGLISAHDSIVFQDRRTAHLYSLINKKGFPVALKTESGYCSGFSNACCPNVVQREKIAEKRLFVEFEGDWIDSENILISDWEVKGVKTEQRTESAKMFNRTLFYCDDRVQQVNGFRFEGVIEFDYNLN